MTSGSLKRSDLCPRFWRSHQECGQTPGKAWLHLSQQTALQPSEGGSYPRVVQKQQMIATGPRSATESLRPGGAERWMIMTQQQSTLVTTDNSQAPAGKVAVGRTPLGVPWLRLRAPNAGALCSIPGQRTKIPHSMCCGQKEKTSFKIKKKKMACKGLASTASEPWYLVSTWILRPNPRKTGKSSWIDRHSLLPPWGLR